MERVITHSAERPKPPVSVKIKLKVTLALLSSEV
jgi:hypothetical protein